MMVFDELYNLALQCGYKCGYPFPWSPPLNPWLAWVYTFGAIVMGVGFLVIGVALIVMAVMRLRKFEA
jgi:hypothetical protein